MKELKGKTAFITGGASGIGLALGRAFADAGMSLMLADIETAALEKAVAELKASGARAQGVACDVSDAGSMHAAAARTLEAYGKVHVLCNNAGVARGGLTEQISDADWDWVLGVNLKGVVHGLQAFLPQMKAHGEPGHIVNTASLYGVLADSLVSPYVASKFAVVGLSEVLAHELEGSPISVSVLCPSWVRTRIYESWRNRPERFGGPQPPKADAALAVRAAASAAALRSGSEPGAIAAQVVRAVREDQFYIFPHPESRASIEARQQRLLAAFDGPVRPQAVNLAQS